MQTRRLRYSQRVTTAIALMIAILIGTPASTPATAAAGPPTGTASDGPGALSYFDLARKDCLGTARNTTSKVWYTVAGGVLSDVYYPTIDNTNAKTLEYIVTDGATFTDLQSRDTTYTVRALDAGGMVCQVTSTARNGKYQIITDYVTDPARNAVLMRVAFKALIGRYSDYKFYVRFDPTVNGNGGGGAQNAGSDSGVIDTSTGRQVLVAADPVLETNAANRDYAQPVYIALDSSSPFSEASNGFVGAPSDGLIQLDTSHRLTALFANANNGNLVQTAQVPLTGQPITLALGFGPSQEHAVQTAAQALADNFLRIRRVYEAEWKSYDAKLKKPLKKTPGLSDARVRELNDSYYVSANVVKASEDKTFPGAIIAGLASPWGQSVPAGNSSLTYFGSYREVFARDLYEAWTGLFAVGDLATARDTVTFLFERQQLPDGSMPRNSLINGKPAPDSFGIQLDETAYPILMAYQLGMTDANLYHNHIKPAANFVASRGPAFGVERWEEQPGFSPSTIAAEIAGLIAAADIAGVNGDAASAALWRGVADDFQRSIKGWTVTTNGPLAPRYFIRLSKTGDPNAAISYNLGNGGPTLDQRQVIDAGFLELARLGILPADDPDILASLPVVDNTIRRETSSGPGWLRYNGDGYGDRASDGRPWAPTGQGNGHIWPVLSAERAAHALATGDQATAAALLDSMNRFASGVGLVPEQDWELPDLPPSPFGTNPEVASIGFQNGKPAGSAAPLTWAAAAYVRLIRNIATNTIVEQPANTAARYITHTQGTTSLAVDSPADQSAVNGSPVTVSGTTAPGNQVFVLATNTDDPASPATTASTTANPDGSFSVAVVITGGTTVIDVVAVASSGGTAHVRRTIVFDFTPGTVLFETTDPLNDDNGPGNYAYPTSGDFKPGAFDIERFQVLDDGTNIIFRLQTRDLTPTFGSPLGAQLVDVYVHDPAASTTSTAASFPQRNYQIGSAFAWNRLIEVQGFGQRYVDAGGTTLGTVTIRANAISRFITFSVPKTSLGQPGAGWAFTVVLTGQDGFSPDQARSFAPTPQPFQFGVCATASSDPACTVDPNTVPKALDILTPAGVSQADVLDYTEGPVILQGLTIP